MEFHDWQKSSKCRLVDDFLVILRQRRVCQGRKLLYDPFIITTGIHLYNEVTTLYTGIGGIGTKINQETYILRTVSLNGVADGQVAKETREIVVLIQVCSHIHMSTESDSQGVVDQTQLVEV